MKTITLKAPCYFNNKLKCATVSKVPSHEYERDLVKRAVHLYMATGKWRWSLKQSDPDDMPNKQSPKKARMDSSSCSIISSESDSDNNSASDIHDSTGNSESEVTDMSEEESEIDMELND